jgi:hypothetical protein
MKFMKMKKNYILITAITGIVLILVYFYYPFLNGEKFYINSFEQGFIIQSNNEQLKKSGRIYYH